MVASVLVAAEPDRVYPAFTDSAELAAWFWPAAFNTHYELDARPGGRFRIRTETGPGGENFGVQGEYLELTPPLRIAMTWQWDGADAVTDVAVELADAGEGSTEVTVTHAANPTVQERDDHVQGWTDCLDRLARHFE